MVAQPGEDGADDFVLGGASWKVEQIRAGQRREARPQSRARLRDDEEERRVAFPVAPGVLDGEPRLADAAEAVKGLLVDDDARSRGVEVGGQAFEDGLTALEQAAKGLEGQVAGAEVRVTVVSAL